MSGDALGAGFPLPQTAVTDANGCFAVSLPDGRRFVLDVFGAPAGRTTFHGDFDARRSAVRDIALSATTSDERGALAELNRFRTAPGGELRFAVAPTLVFDENLTRSARFWAAQEARAGRVGHTCAALGKPAGCIEFNAYFHALPGAPQDWNAGQNAAFDTVASWSDPNEGFEDEGKHCAPAYDWKRCGPIEGSATGHFINVMAARRWVGLGEAPAPGVGTYYALNII